MQIQCMLPEDAKNIISLVLKFDTLPRFFIWECDMSLQTLNPFVDLMHKNA